MINVTRTYDKELVRKICTHPDIYKNISDDGSPNPEDFDPIDPIIAIYALLDDGEMIGGVFILLQTNAVCYDLHTCILPHWWGGKSFEAARCFLDWVPKETQCKKLITWVPEFNRIALKFALKAGFKKEGLNEKSYLKDGVLYDQTLLGLICHSPPPSPT